jgi:hypothetical protein
MKMAKQTREVALETDELPIMRSAFEIIGDWLDTNDWGYQVYPDKGYYSMGFNGKSGSWRVIVDATLFDNVERVIVYSVYPIRISEYKRSVVSELIARINYGMSVGNFELDFNDGEIRMKTSLDLVGVQLTDDTFDKMFSANLGTTNRYLSAIYGVAFGEVSPKLAIEVAERPADETLQ